MADWNDYRYFLALARSGTLAATARELGVEHTTVSRRIAALEQALETKLFVRTRDGFVLTEAGRAALCHVERASTALDEIECSISGDDNELRGNVRLTTSEGFASYVIKALAELRGRAPDVVVQVLTNDRVVDLTRHEADIALRIAPTPQQDLVMRKVGAVGWRMYASESYVARAGLPASASELAGHDLIGYDERHAALPGAKWIENHSTGARIAMRGSSLVSVLNAAISGLGLAVVPCHLGAGEPSLRCVPGDTITRHDVFIVVHPDLSKIARIRTVMDFFAEVIGRDTALLSG